LKLRLVPENYVEVMEVPARSTQDQDVLHGGSPADEYACIIVAGVMARRDPNHIPG
jgi:hypothetical protein